MEPVFHENSYGYRPNHSALQALAVARKRCWRRDWVIDLDIKGFFDNLDHDLMMKAVKHHIKEPWVLLYIKRWLEAPADDGKELIERSMGTPQGGVISPLLANLFMHYAFDYWLERNIQNVWFERYADDAVIHCRTRQEAESILERVRQRLKDCGLTLHPEKTKLVYCKDVDRQEKHENTSFDFLSYTFRPRMTRSRNGRFFVSFLPAISKASAQYIRDTIRDLEIPTKRSLNSLDELAKLLNPYVQGWINYYGKFYRSELKTVLNYVEATLVRWAMGKYKKLKGRKKRASCCLGKVAKRAPRLMAHWRIGCVSAVG